MSIESVKCPECGGKMVPRDGKFGKFWGCTEYPSCRGTRDSMGMSKQDRDDAIADGEDGEIGAPHHFGRWDR